LRGLSAGSAIAYLRATWCGHASLLEGAASRSVGWQREAMGVPEVVSANPAATAATITKQADARSIAARHSVVQFAGTGLPGTSCGQQRRRCAKGSLL
jgi:hypothetical protein